MDNKQFSLLLKENSRKSNIEILKQFGLQAEEVIKIIHFLDLVIDIFVKSIADLSNIVHVKYITNGATDTVSRLRYTKKQTPSIEFIKDFNINLETHDSGILLKSEEYSCDRPYDFADIMASDLIELIKYSVYDKLYSLADNTFTLPDDYYMVLAAIQREAHGIARKTNRGPANRLVLSIPNFVRFHDSNVINPSSIVFNTLLTTISYNNDKSFLIYNAGLNDKIRSIDTAATLCIHNPVALKIIDGNITINMVYELNTDEDTGKYISNISW